MKRKSARGRPAGKTIVEIAVADFERSLVERNASAHTIKAYRGDLENFAAYVGSRNWHDIDHVAIRRFLSHLYEKGLGKTSVARSLAAVRSLYRWLGAGGGLVEQNPAALVSTPKLAKKLPRGPTIEEMNSVFDGEMPEAASFPERDRLMFELLYGCGIRNSELIGINLDDIRLSAEAILIRGKGKKERYVPFGDSVKAALATYLPARQRLCTKRPKSNSALLINLRGGRLTTRSVGRIVKRNCGGQRTFCRTSIPTPCAMPSALIYWRRAPTSAPFRRCSATSVFPPPSAIPSFPSSKCPRGFLRSDPSPREIGTRRQCFAYLAYMTLCREHGSSATAA